MHWLSRQFLQSLGIARSYLVESVTHRFKYRLAYVVKGVCVVRYGNESRKGDHRHFGNKESSYVFVNPEQLMADFQKDIAGWNRENRDS